MLRFLVAALTWLAACTDPPRDAPQAPAAPPPAPSVAPASSAPPSRAPTAMACHQRGARPAFATTECYATLSECETAARSDAGAACTWVEHPFCTTVKPGELPPGPRCFADESRCRTFQTDISSSADYSKCAAR